MKQPITHLIAVRESAFLFAELAKDIIRKEAEEPIKHGQTYAQITFGTTERDYTLTELSDRVLRPAVESIVTDITRIHKKICACASRKMLAIPDEWSGDAIALDNGISMRLVTRYQGDPDREVTRMDVLYGIANR